MHTFERNESSAATAAAATIAKRLQLSTVTPANYSPSNSIRYGEHAAVFAGDYPVILCGPSYCKKSTEQANQLAQSEDIKRLFALMGKEGEIRSGVVDGRKIAWENKVSALAPKASGKVELGDEIGSLLAIILGDKQSAIATAISITTKTARIFDADVPELELA